MSLKLCFSVLLIVALNFAFGYAWVIKTGNYQSITAAEAGSVRWSNDAPDSKTGLQGGLDYAISQRFCDQMIPTFRLEIVECDEIKAAIASAFTTWSANHKLFKFSDKSNQCKAERLYAADNQPVCDNLPVEITVDVFEPDYNYKRVGDVGFNGGNWVAITVYTLMQGAGNVGSQPPVRTDGVITTGASLAQTNILFNTTTCWYLDQDFCAGMFSLYGGSDDSKLIATQAVVFVIWIVCLLPFIYWLFRFIVAYHKEDKIRQYGKTMRFLNSWYAQFVSLWLGVVIMCPVFYYHVFQPCAECNHFESTMAHEIGHAMGLDHPDDDILRHRNFQYATADGPWNCEIGKDSTPAIGIQMGMQSETKTIMTTVQNRELHKTCLTDDDMGALQFLYPCGEFDTPNCSKPDTGRGVQRTMLVIFLPLVGCMMLVSVLICLVRWRTGKDDEKLKDLLHQQATGGAKSNNLALYSRWAAAANEEAHDDLHKEMKGHEVDDKAKFVCTVSVDGEKVGLTKKELAEFKEIFKTFEPDPHTKAIDMSHIREHIKDYTTSSATESMFLNNMPLSDDEEEDETLTFAQFVPVFIKTFGFPGKGVKGAAQEDRPPRDEAAIEDALTRYRKAWEKFCDNKGLMTHEDVDGVLRELGFDYPASFLNGIWSMFSLDTRSNINFEDFISLYIPMFTAQQKAQSSVRARSSSGASNATSSDDDEPANRSASRALLKFGRTVGNLQKEISTMNALKAVDAFKGGAPSNPKGPLGKAKYLVAKTTGTSDESSDYDSDSRSSSSGRGKKITFKL
eukprot:GFYU01011187.1.p1 GENE.GFYU01011187.1~~GFYU01011187.1.p1  ORF type:complete len:793 (-),score=270.96 GFYU01011187.1:323-2701(-)